MSVYVDNYNAKFGNMTMCHMAADTLAELHAMADTIGVARRHIQKSASGIVHYDICKAKRALAVKAGAIEITATEMVRRFSPFLRGKFNA